MSDVEEPTSPVREAERMLLTAFLTARGLVLASGAVVIETLKPSFHIWRLGVATFLLALVESVWLAARTVPRRALDPLTVWVDALTCAVVLISFEKALLAGELGGAADWAISLAYTMVLGAAVAHRRMVTGLLTTLGLETLVLLGRGLQPFVSVLNGGSSPPAFASLLGSLLYLPGFYIAAYFVQKKVRQWALRQENLQTLRREAERTLAVEQERNRQHRLIHDTVLQVVEAIGSGLLPYDEARAQARTEAVRLRRALEGDGVFAGGDLWTAMVDLVEEFTGVGVRVELTSDGSPANLAEDRLSALVFASREALTNVRRHAKVGSAVMNVSELETGYRVIVRDRGTGFDPAHVNRGYGLANSISRRMEDVGGRAEVWSEPGQGTRVSLWVPK